MSRLSWRDPRLGERMISLSLYCSFWLLSKLKKLKQAVRRELARACFEPSPRAFTSRPRLLHLPHPLRQATALVINQK